METIGSVKEVGVQFSTPTKKNKIKILIVTTPIRPVPSIYPPIGSLSVIKALRKSGCEAAELYDIDAMRPSYETVLEYIKAYQPEIFGISAVVSTAYEYTKKLSLDVKRLLPNVTIVLGGNLGASAEILLRKTGVDFVVAGEGERTMAAFVKRYQETKERERFLSVSGLVYLDKNNQLVNTGYPIQIPKEEVYDIDWTDLERNSDISIFFPQATKSLLGESVFAKDPRAFEEHRQGKAIGTLVGSKGCVAKCTFCHRWDKGIRYIPVPILMERLKYIIDRYNVGFVDFGDENFGTDKKWLREFCESIKQFDVLWRVAGMRVNCISPEYLYLMREVGCSAVYFGMETGSEKMLQIMEKKVKLEDNYNALKWINETRLNTTIQLVLAMPGETPETIKETARFAAYGACLSKNNNPLELSVNFAQALPGTSLYEYARNKGLIGETVDEEEKYLLSISDRNASDKTTTLRLTEYPKLITEAWRPYITVTAAAAYVRKFGQKAYDDQLLKSQYFSIENSCDRDDSQDPVVKRASKETGYFNFPKEKRGEAFVFEQTEKEKAGHAKVDISSTTDTIRDKKDERIKLSGMRLPGLLQLLRLRRFHVIMVRYPLLSYRLRFFLPVFVFLSYLADREYKFMAKLLFEYISYRCGNVLSKKKFQFAYKSLRKIVDHDIGINPEDDRAMEPLRRGR